MNRTRWLPLALLVGCRAPAEAPAQDVATPAGAVELPVEPSGPIEHPRRETTLGVADLRPIREVTLELPSDTEGYAMRKPAGRRTVFRGKHLQLAGRGPLGPRRVLVARREAADFGAPIVETHLVDLDRGSIAKFWAATRWIAPNLGLAVVLVEEGGRRRRALLHASDGLMVPLDEGLDASNTEVVINPGRGDGWVFTHDPANPDAPTRYGHWTDLRVPPPQPDRVLPFSAINLRYFESSEQERSEERLAMTRIVLPTLENPADVAPLVYDRADPDDSASRRVELLPDGGFAPANYIRAMAGGWRMTSDGRNPVFFNVETREVERVDLAKHCRSLGSVLDAGLGENAHAYSGFTFDPPRTWFPCGSRGTDILWSPGSLEEVRWHADDRDYQIDSSASRSVETHVFIGGEHRTVSQWLDSNERVLISTTELSNASGFEWDRVPALAQYESDGVRVFTLAFENASLIRVVDTRCSDLADEGESRTAWLITCEDHARRLLWSEAVDHEGRTRTRLPPPAGPWNARIWILEPGRSVVSVRIAAGGEELTEWALVAG